MLQGLRLFQGLCLFLTLDYLGQGISFNFVVESFKLKKVNQAEIYCNKHLFIPSQHAFTGANNNVNYCADSERAPSFQKNMALDN